MLLRFQPKTLAQKMEECAEAFREFGRHMASAEADAIEAIDLAQPSEVERAAESIGREAARYPLDLAAEIERLRLPWWRRWL